MLDYWAPGIPRSRGRRSLPPNPASGSSICSSTAGMICDWMSNRGAPLITAPRLRRNGSGRLRHRHLVLPHCRRHGGRDLCLRIVSTFPRCTRHPAPPHPDPVAPRHRPVRAGAEARSRHCPSCWKVVRSCYSGIPAAATRARDVRFVVAPTDQLPFHSCAQRRSPCNKSTRGRRHG